MESSIKFLCISTLLFSAVTAQSTSKRPETRLSDGSPVRPTDTDKNKFMAVITDESSRALCGAFICNPNWFITAAHCVANRPDYMEKSGQLNIQIGVKAPIMTQIKEIVTYPTYNAFTGVDDIAVVKISGGIEFNSKIGTIPIANQTATIGTHAYVIGYGLTEPTSENLYYKQVKVVSSSNCDHMVEGQICASPGGVGTGDAGNPLVSLGKLVGIAISDTNYGTAKQDKYVDVAHYKDWIDSYCAAPSIFLSPLAVVSMVIALFRNMS